MEVHLDLIGGLAGDMFIAALLDALPQFEARVVANINAVQGHTGVVCCLAEHKDDVLQGHRFSVRSRVATAPAGAMVGWRGACTTIGQDHTPWSVLRKRLLESALPVPVSRHAVAIFQLLADAEAVVHGVDTAAVEFHEVGAWDSIADIVGAATLIDACNARRWTFSAVPLGSGRVCSQHGIMPVPAPATARLLQGMATLDDGIAGERVTPTGAAILRYLREVGCESEPAKAAAGDVTRTLVASGTGFGSRVLAGISNHVRVLCFEATSPPVLGHRRMEVIEFEVDDQTGEDLAIGLERLRAHATVLDVVQSSVYGKKGRMMAKIQVLARPERLDAVIEACFRETTTIGLRHHAVHGVALERRVQTVHVEGQDLRVKVVNRPGGRTAKTECDDVQRQEGHAARIAMRSDAECAVLEHPAEPLNAR